MCGKSSPVPTPKWIKRDIEVGDPIGDRTDVRQDALPVVLRTERPDPRIEQLEHVGA